MASLMMPISISVSTVAAILGSFLMKRVNIKYLITSGSIIMVISLLIASFMKAWWTFVLICAILFPVGAGLVYWIPIICAWEWFPQRKGLVSGIIFGGFGLG